MAASFKVVKSISRALMYVTYAAMLALLVITVWDVIARYVFNRPSSGVTEWSQMFLITCMTCMAHALIEGRMISVGVIVERFHKKVNAAIEIGMGVAAFAFFLIAGYQLILLSQFSTVIGEEYFVIRVPKWPMYAILSISFLACAMTTVVYVIERLQKLFAPPIEKSALDNPEIAFLMGSEKDAKKEGGAAS